MELTGNIYRYIGTKYLFILSDMYNYKWNKNTRIYQEIKNYKIILQRYLDDVNYRTAHQEKIDKEKYFTYITYKAAWSLGIIK